MTLFENAYIVPENKNYNKLLNLIRSKRSLKILDVGCGNCKNSLRIKRFCPNSQIFGVDMFKVIDKSKYDLLKIDKLNLETDSFRYEDESFNIVLSNMVIEHIDNIKHFINEQKRVLKDNGLLIISTNNSSSWHNIFSLILGWQPFDLTNITLDLGLGNPLARYRGIKKDETSIGMIHKRIYTIRYLKDFLKLNGFIKIRSFGEGYFPFPSFFGRIDKIHSQFFIIVGVKNAKR